MVEEGDDSLVLRNPSAVKARGKAHVERSDHLILGQGVKLRLGEEPMCSLHNGWRQRRTGGSVGGWVGAAGGGGSDLSEGPAFLTTGNCPSMTVAWWGRVKVEDACDAVGRWDDGSLSKVRDLGLGFRCLGGGGHLGPI